MLLNQLNSIILSAFANTYENYKYFFLALSAAILFGIVFSIIYFYRKGNIERAERSIRIYTAIIAISIIGLIFTYYLFY
jgi:hypothetical protein